jgi:hypothetical protein
VGDLPRFVRDLLAAPPRHGEGVHSYLFRLARVLHWYRGEKEIVAMLNVLTADCGRRVPEREILNAVRNAKRAEWNPARYSSQIRPPRWPAVNQEQREAIIATGFGLVDLWELSPIRFEDQAAHTEEIVDQLFPGNPFLCVGAATHNCHTAPRDKWRERLSSLPLIVPNMMTASTGRNQNGEVSKRCLGNTGARRFLVVEFDTGTIDDHAALLRHLEAHAPLALAVFSGAKSLHGWFSCADVAEEKVFRFFRYAVSLGADRATWTRCQLVRMPDGTRENGKRQVVYFFNPRVVK